MMNCDTSEIYAKIYYKNGKPYAETLKSHTENLIKQIELLKKFYKNELNQLGLDEIFFKHLKIACIFHDLGKISSHFQFKIRKIINQKVHNPVNLPMEIPHNFLSGIFLLDKNVKKAICKEFFNLIFYAVTFHHQRDFDFSQEDLKEIISDLKDKTTQIKWIENFGFKIENIDENKSLLLFKKLEEYVHKKNNILSLKKDRKFIFLKGFLHRADYSASAQLPIEEKRIENPEEKLFNFLSKKENFSGLKQFQKQAINKQDKNILLTASTGIGKTEFAINWMGKSKTFYTLPLRVSVNAMYERFSKIFGKENIGLLHNDAIFYIFNRDRLFNELTSIQQHIVNTKLTRLLSMPVTITTADQIFTAVFKYEGYEKIYSTLAYSKIVLDEPQSYSPDTLAVILKGLQEISNIGGKFCFMSATIYPFIIEYLNDFCEIFPPIFHKEKKHKIKLVNKNIEELKDEIIEAYKKGKKILIIVNTVKKAQSLFKILEKEKVNLEILHSLFILKHRQYKENKILNIKEPQIWITTQIVEASLDIDFDILFTEISTLDSLIQRMGRIFRKIGRSINENDKPNIIVAISNPSDNGKIYDREVVKKTISTLKYYDEKIITEEKKHEIMEEVYNLEFIKNTKFFEKFNKNLELLELGFEIETTKEAQKLFRAISNINVIPQEIYEKNYEKINQLLENIIDKSKTYLEKLMSIYNLNLYTLSIPFYKSKNISAISNGKFKKQIFTVNYKYDESIGLTFEDSELEKII